MGSVVFICIVLIGMICAQERSIGVSLKNSNVVDTPDTDLSTTDLVLAFAIFRHGDRTPDQEELDLYPAQQNNLKKSNLFFPYGMKALTNKGKQRAFLVGEHLRRRYDGFISRLYLPNEIKIRTTDYDRTKMTALTALAALYPPVPAQTWNPMLNWQPVPYDTMSFEEDDLLYWYNCEPYRLMRDRAYESPEIAKAIKSQQGLFTFLSEKTGNNITKPEDVFYLDNLFQTLENVGVKPPKWAQEIMPKIQEITKLEYSIEFSNDDLIRLAVGVMMGDIINATMAAAISGNLDQPKLRLYSAHENNVAAFMSASRVFQPHQPKYGSTFSLELRRSRLNGRYGIAAIYCPTPGGPTSILPIRGCGGNTLCDFDTFVNLTHDIVLNRNEYKKHCSANSE